MIHLSPPAPQLSLEKLLAKYNSERRRKRMTKAYANSLKTVTEAVQPEMLLDRFQADHLPELEPFAAAETKGYFLGLCTLGQQLDQEIETLNRQDIVTAAIAEEIALAMIVSLTNELRQHATELIDRNRLKVGPAYRPGVGRWPIELQSLIFKHLPTLEIGVTLSEFMVMSPSKSTSVIIPVLPG